METWFPPEFADALPSMETCFPQASQATKNKAFQLIFKSSVILVCHLENGLVGWRPLRITHSRLLNQMKQRLSYENCSYVLKRWAWPSFWFSIKVDEQAERSGVRQFGGNLFSMENRGPLSDELSLRLKILKNDSTILSQNGHFYGDCSHCEEGAKEKILAFSLLF